MTPLRSVLVCAAILLAGCAVPDNPSRSTASGESEIRISDGRNCWNNRCFRFNSSNRAIQVLGKNAVRVPRGIDLSSGYVSEAEFAAIFQAANAAYASGVGRR